MTYISACSGIEACTVAWETLGWKPLFFSEIEKFPSAVLKHHYPNIENKGDITKYEEWERCPVDLVVGGTPCQSFSIAGKRRGLQDIGGQLMYSYLGIVGKYQPKWVLWENVPGVLSNNKGLDFANFLCGLEELGYGWCYRVLDAKYFGVPQHRERVFVVGHIGGRTDRAAQVLFEQESLRRDVTKSKGKKQADTIGAKNSTRTTMYDNRGFSNMRKCENFTQPVMASYAKQNDNCTLVIKNKLYNSNSTDGRITDSNGICQTVTHHFHKGAGSIPMVYESNPTDARIKPLGDKCSTVLSRWGTGDNQVPLVLEKQNATCYSRQSFSEYKESTKSSTLTNRHADEQTIVVENPKGMHTKTVRRITPLETERLQGLPDNYTRIPWNGKETKYCPDSLRYKVTGNSMAIPVMAWLAERIEAVDKGQIYG